jgi:hypothetical protein
MTLHTGNTERAEQEARGAGLLLLADAPDSCLASMFGLIWHDLSCFHAAMAWYISLCSFYCSSGRSHGLQCNPQCRLPKVVQGLMC